MRTTAECSLTLSIWRRDNNSHSTLCALKCLCVYAACCQLIHLRSSLLTFTFPFDLHISRLLLRIILTRESHVSFRWLSTYVREYLSSHSNKPGAIPIECMLEDEPTCCCMMHVVRVRRKTETKDIHAHIVKTNEMKHVTLVRMRRRRKARNVHVHVQVEWKCRSEK